MKAWFEDGGVDGRVEHATRKALEEDTGVDAALEVELPMLMDEDSKVARWQGGDLKSRAQLVNERGMKAWLDEFMTRDISKFVWGRSQAATGQNYISSCNFEMGFQRGSVDSTFLQKGLNCEMLCSLESNDVVGICSPFGVVRFGLISHKGGPWI